MRPAGEIRMAVKAKAWELAQGRAGHGVTFLDVLAELEPRRFGRQAVVTAWKNLAKAGELARVGEVRLPHSCRPLVAYAPAQLVDGGQKRLAPGLALQRTWSV